MRARRIHHHVELAEHLVALCQELHRPGRRRPQAGDLRVEPEVTSRLPDARQEAVDERGAVRLEVRLAVPPQPPEERRVVQAHDRGGRARLEEPEGVRLVALDGFHVQAGPAERRLGLGVHLHPASGQPQGSGV